MDQARVGLADALEHLREADRLLREIDSPIELANARCAKARAASDIRDPGLAREALAEVRAIASAIAATAESVLLRQVDEIESMLA